MSVATAVKARFDELRSFDGSTLTLAYQPIGLQLTVQPRLVKITNLSNVNILISTNGDTDHDVVSANGFSLYDIATNRSDKGGLYEISQGDRFYVKLEAAAVAPIVGNIYVTVLYASET